MPSAPAAQRPPAAPDPQISTDGVYSVGQRAEKKIMEEPPGNTWFSCKIFIVQSTVINIYHDWKQKRRTKQP